MNLKYLNFILIAVLISSQLLHAKNLDDGSKIIAKEKLLIIANQNEAPLKVFNAYKELLRLKPNAEKLRVNFLLFLLKHPEVISSKDRDSEFKINLASLKKSQNKEIQKKAFEILDAYLLNSGKTAILEKRLLKEKRFLDLSKISIKSKKYGEAERLLKQEISTNGISEEAYFTLGLIYLLDNRKGLLRMTVQNMKSSYPESEKTSALDEIDELSNLDFRDKSFSNPLIEVIARRKFTLNESCPDNIKNAPEKIAILCSILNRNWAKANQLLKSSDDKSSNLYNYYLGLIEELEKNRFAKAIDYYKKAKEASNEAIVEAIDLRLSVLEQ